jgi:mevalonate pyrophosphate decarboxylase
MNNELRNIISGTGEITARNLIQTALFYLRESKTTSGKIEESELVNKKDEIERLFLLADQNHLWYQSINDSTYIGEQKVYLNEDGKNVIKLNDTIFYSSWEEYFISLLIHNYLFVKTSYNLILYTTKI